MEWRKKYRGASDTEVITQALGACSRCDCEHCLYQGRGIKCAVRLKRDAAQLIENMAI